MYCKRCGYELAARAKFCPHCGNPVFVAFPSNKKPMWVMLIFNVLVVASAFMRVHYLDAVRTTEFSSLGLYKTMKDFFYNMDDYLGFVRSGLFGFGSQVFETDEMQLIASVITGIIIFDLLMYLIGIAEVVFEFLYLIFGRNDFSQDGRFWRAAISSSLGIFIGNSIVFGTLWTVNKFIEALINEYFTVEVDLMGSTETFYVLQGIAIVVYIVARVQYRKWKKTMKAFALP